MALARVSIGKAVLTPPAPTPSLSAVADPAGADDAVLQELTDYFASRDAIAPKQLPERLLAQLEELDIPAQAARVAGRFRNGSGDVRTQPATARSNRAPT
jgi:hypothetical protein